MKGYSNKISESYTKLKEELPYSTKNIHSYGLRRGTEGPNYLPIIPRRKYDPLIVPQEYNNNQRNSSKETYFEMIRSDFSRISDRIDTGLDFCEICEAPVPKPFRRCPNCYLKLWRQ